MSLQLRAKGGHFGFQFGLQPLSVQEFNPNTLENQFGSVQFLIRFSSVQFGFIIWIGFRLLIQVQIWFGLLIWIGLLIQANFGYSNHYLKKKSKTPNDEKYSQIKTKNSKYSYAFLKFQIMSSFTLTQHYELRKMLQ